MKLNRTGSGCLCALLRVPRPAASSFTCAEHTGSPIPGTWYSRATVKGHISQQRAGGVCRSAVKEESKGGSLWTGDMSADGYPQPVASPEQNLGAPSTGQAQYHCEFHIHRPESAGKTRMPVSRSNFSGYQIRVSSEAAVQTSNRIIQ